MTRPIWFKRKTYGWGWVPATWQGWAILGAYTGGLATILLRIDSATHSGIDTFFNYILPVGGLTVLLLVITFLTGEKPRWQWGDKDTHDS